MSRCPGSLRVARDDELPEASAHISEAAVNGRSLDRI